MFKVSIKEQIWDNLTSWPTSSLHSIDVWSQTLSSGLFLPYIYSTKHWTVVRRSLWFLSNLLAPGVEGTHQVLGATTLDHFWPSNLVFQCSANLHCFGSWSLGTALESEEISRGVHPFHLAGSITSQRFRQFLQPLPGIASQMAHDGEVIWHFLSTRASLCMRAFYD